MLIDHQGHELHSDKSPSRLLAADEFCGRRGAGNSNRLRGTVGLTIVLPASAAKRLFSFPGSARLRDRLRRGLDHAAHSSRRASPVSRALWFDRADTWNLVLPDADVFSAGRKLAAPLYLAGDRIDHLLHLWASSQPPGKSRREALAAILPPKNKFLPAGDDKTGPAW